MGHHYVHSHFPGFREHNLEPDQGSSNHYRICELGGFDCLKRPTEVEIKHEYSIYSARTGIRAKIMIVFRKPNDAT